MGGEINMKGTEGREKGGAFSEVTPTQLAPTSPLSGSASLVQPTPELTRVLFKHWPHRSILTCSSYL